MSEKPVTVEVVAYGAREAMIAEVGACDYYKSQRDAGWKVDARNFRYCVMILGDAQFDTEYFRTIKDAMENAKEAAEFYGVKTWRV